MDDGRFDVVGGEEVRGLEADLIGEAGDELVGKVLRLPGRAEGRGGGAGVGDEMFSGYVGGFLVRGGDS